MGSERPQCLVIDGHPLVRLGVREALRDGFQVHESANRAEGLELIRDVGSIDVAIVDLRRWSAREDNSEPSGREAIRTLHQAEPGMGIVAHGERPERHIANAALQAGATAYVARTARPEDLRRAVAGGDRPGTVRRPGGPAEREPRPAHAAASARSCS